MDVVDRIVKVETDAKDQPITPVTLEVNVIEMAPDEIAGLGFEPNR